MKKEDAENFLNWLWLRLAEELEIGKALNNMPSFERRRMEYEIQKKLEEEIR